MNLKKCVPYAIDIQVRHDKISGVPGSKSI